MDIVFETKTKRKKKYNAKELLIIFSYKKEGRRKELANRFEYCVPSQTTFVANLFVVISKNTMNW